MAKNVRLPKFDDSNFYWEVKEIKRINDLAEDIHREYDISFWNIILFFVGALLFSVAFIGVIEATNPILVLVYIIVGARLVTPVINRAIKEKPVPIVFYNQDGSERFETTITELRTSKAAKCAVKLYQFVEVWNRETKKLGVICEPLELWHPKIWTNIQHADQVVQHAQIEIMSDLENGGWKGGGSSEHDHLIKRLEHLMEVVSYPSRGILR